MTRSRSWFSLLLVAVSWPAACGTPAVDWPAVRRSVPADSALEARISALLARMTLEQKVGQMVQAEIQHVTPAEVREYHLGSVLNGGGSFPGGAKHATVADWVALADAYYDASMDTTGGRLAIPIIWGTDAVHGHNNVIGATLFPHNIGLGAMRDPDLVRRIGEATALEVRATGLDWTFAPTLAVVRDDRWGRTYEGYSEDPALVRAYAASMLAGLQGQAGTAAFLDASHLVATAKHFLGDGGTDGGVDRGDNLSTEQELLDIHAQGYFAALRAGAQTVMASFNSWRGEKLHGHRHLLTDVLKDRLGFDGFVVSDWNGIGEVTGCTDDSCPAAINAGIDMLMVPEDWKDLLANTVAQVRAGEIPETRIDDAVRRILRVKLRAGLFARGRPSSRRHAGDTTLVGTPSHRALARQTVRQSLVLLKNAGGLLPLRRDQRVLVAGSAADNVGMQTGGWSITWQGTENANADFPGATSIADGIAAVVAEGGGTVIRSADGSFTERPDVAVVVFGEEPYAEMFGDLTSLSFSAEYPGPLAVLRRLAADGIPVVAVFLSGRPRWVNPELNASRAFVAAWLPGTEGAGIADVLFRTNAGDVHYDVVGRLPYSWPREPMQSPLNVNDADYRPLFPYGYGVGYAATDTLPGTLPEADPTTVTGRAVRRLPE